MRLDYHAIVRTRFIQALALGVLLASTRTLPAQEDQPPSKSQPSYDDTFAGPIVELTTTKVTVSRNVLGKTEKRTFLIKTDTRIEGKLRVKEKVTVGFVTTDEGDIARLIVAHPNGKEQK